MNVTNGLIAPVLLGIACAFLAYFALAERPLLFLTTPRAELIALLALGSLMCAGGIGQVAASGRWLSVVAFIGYLLGAALLYIFAAVLFGWKVPFVQGVSQTVILTAALMGVKFLIATVNFFVSRA